MSKLNVYVNKSNDSLNGEKINISNIIENQLYLSFETDPGLDFVLNYSSKSETIDYNSIEYYDVNYTMEYKSTLVNRMMYTRFQNRIIPKLKDKILVDLGCGKGISPLAVWAYLSNAKAYIGIDVHADSGILSNDEIKKKFLAYGIGGDNHNNNTIFKYISGSFDDFLEKAPDNAGFNFTINGLTNISNNSEIVLNNNLDRLMNSENIILANVIENIDIGDLLRGKGYKKFGVAGFIDTINCFEKASSK